MVDEAAAIEAGDLFIPPSWNDQDAMDRHIDTLAEQPKARRHLRWLAIGGAIHLRQGGSED